MSQTHDLDGIRLTSVDDWLDVTHELEAASPFTLARSDGFGVLQFSTALYERGKLPNIDLAALTEMLHDFANNHSLINGFDAENISAPNLVVARSYVLEGDFMRVWLCSNGRDVLLVTYTCNIGSESTELQQCEQIVASIRFGEGTSPL